MREVAQRLGPLHGRDFRLLFSATTITTLGDRLALIAIAFAVLDLPGGSATDLGIVIAARQVTVSLVLVAGGVLSDRLPRHLVLVGACLVQATAQAVTAGLVLSGGATVAWLVALQVVYGLGDGLLVPAEVGLVPQTVSPARLQQANAMQGLSRNLAGILGPALGGVVVVAASPGAALAADAASFLVCAALLARISVPRRPPRDDAPSFVRELREGWQEFTSQTWLWSTVLLFGVGNMFFASYFVLGPQIAKDELGGAGPWAIVLAGSGVGALLGGLVALRIRPARPLLVAVIAPFPLVLQLAALAAVAPVPVLTVASFLGGAAIAIHLTLWFTVFQQQVPEHAQSRVSSYDALGSFVLMPIGSAVAGPVAVAIGDATTLWIAAAVNAACLVALALVPSVRRIRATPRAPAPLAPERADEIAYR